MSQRKWKALICLRWVWILQWLTSKLCFCLFGGGVLDAGVNPCPPSLTSFSISGQNSSLCSTENLEWIVILAIPPRPHGSFILMKMCCVPFPKLWGYPRITVPTRGNEFSGICVFYNCSFIFKLFQCAYKITQSLSLTGSASLCLPGKQCSFSQWVGPKPAVIHCLVLCWENLEPLTTEGGFCEKGEAVKPPCPQIPQTD